MVCLPENFAFLGARGSWERNGDSTLTSGGLLARAGRRMGESAAQSEPLDGPWMVRLRSRRARMRLQRAVAQTKYCGLAKSQRIWLSLGGFPERAGL